MNYPSNFCSLPLSFLELGRAKSFGIGFVLVT